MSVIVGPYEERVRYERERPFILGETLRRTGEDIARTIFAYHEIKDQELRTRLSAMTEVGQSLGWPNVGQDFLNKRANTFDALIGKGTYPRDAQGNALRPTPTEEEAWKQHFDTMTPEERKQYWDERDKIGPAHRAEEEMQLTREKNDIMRERNWLTSVRDAKGKEMDQDSGYIYDPQKQQVRPTEPGEAGLTNRQLDNYRKERDISLRENNQILALHHYKTWKRHMTYEETKGAGAPTANQVVGWMQHWDKVPDTMKGLAWSMIQRSAREAGVPKELVPDEMPESPGVIARIGRNLRAAGTFVGAINAPSSLAPPATPGAPTTTTTLPPGGGAGTGLPGAPSAEITPPGGVPSGYRRRKLPNGVDIWEPAPSQSPTP